MELIYKKDAIHAVLHNSGQAAVAAMENIKPVANWDMETADKCKLPDLIQGICERCRDYRYCYRPITLFDEEVTE